MNTQSVPWWQNYFSAQYGALYCGPLAAELSTISEIETLHRLFAGVDGPVLDIACGFGRHLISLRKKKVPVIGLDWSESLLRLVPERHRKAVLRGDMKHLPFAEGSFAGACMMFNSFGYFSEEENTAVLGEVARVLRPGASLLLDIPSRAGMVKAATESPGTIRCQGKYQMQELWSYDEGRQRLECRGTWVVGEEQQDWELSLRLYSPAEIRRLLKQAGFSGEVEIRPLEDLEEMGTDAPVPSSHAGLWREIPNMAVLVQR